MSQESASASASIQDLAGTWRIEWVEELPYPTVGSRVRVELRNSTQAQLLFDPPQVRVQPRAMGPTQVDGQATAAAGVLVGEFGDLGSFRLWVEPHPRARDRRVLHCRVTNSIRHKSGSWIADEDDP